MRSLREELLQQAADARTLSTQLCKGGLPDSEGCAWYHGAWPILRILDVVSNPYWHYRFFSKHIKNQLPVEERCHALVMGCADVSSAYLLLDECECCLDVVDLCATPLSFVDRFASSSGREITTFQADILDHQFEHKYDLIFNDAFLTRFNPNEKIAALSKCRETLKVGGMYLTSIRLGGSALARDGGYTSQSNRRNWFVERSLAKFKEIGGVEGFSSEDIENIARSYMRSMASYRFADKS